LLTWATQDAQSIPLTAMAASCVAEDGSVACM